MSIRIRNDVIGGALPHLLEPLRDLLDDRERAELYGYYHEVLTAAFEAYEREKEKSLHRLNPLARPSEN